MSIVYPLDSNKMLARIRKIRKSYMIAGIWMCGFVIASPEYLMHRIEVICSNGRQVFVCKDTRLHHSKISYALL